MSLIEKIDAEMQWLNERLDTARIEHDKLGIWKTKGMIYEAEKMKEIILSEQKEPCEYCKKININICTQEGRFVREMNYCSNCGRLINKQKTNN